MSELEGTTCLITGANTGIGRATARELVRRGATVFITARSEEKAQPVIEQLQAEVAGARLRFLALELGDLESVRACAQAFRETGEPLHALINNAGVAGQRGLTPSGFELCFGTNHIGHFLLTELLLDRLCESAPARIVNLSSDAHYSASGIDFDAVRRPTRSVTTTHEYAVSKLANVLHAQELARRLEGSGVTSYALHPGVVGSDIWRRVPWPARPLMKLRMISPEDGARTSVYCATAPELAQVSGRYYENCREKELSPVATPELGRELWERSSGWVSQGATA